MCRHKLTYYTCRDFQGNHKRRTVEECPTYIAARRAYKENRDNNYRTSSPLCRTTRQEEKHPNRLCPHCEEQPVLQPPPRSADRRMHGLGAYTMSSRQQAPSRLAERRMGGTPLGGATMSARQPQTPGQSLPRGQPNRRRDRPVLPKTPTWDAAAERVHHNNDDGYGYARPQQQQTSQARPGLQQEKSWFEPPSDDEEEDLGLRQILTARAAGVVQNMGKRASKERSTRTRSEQKGKRKRSGWSTCIVIHHLHKVRGSNAAMCNHCNSPRARTFFFQVCHNSPLHAKGASCSNCLQKHQTTKCRTHFNYVAPIANDGLIAQTIKTNGTGARRSQSWGWAPGVVWTVLYITSNDKRGGRRLPFTCYFPLP